MRRSFRHRAAVALALGALFAWLGCARGGGHFERPPVTVSALQARAEVWTPTLDAVGSLRAVEGVRVAAEVPGRVAKIAFASGQTVAKDDLLVQLDDSADRAHLDGLVAEEKLAQLHLQRTRKLYAARSVSKSNLDEAQANYDRARAQVDEQRALIAKKAIRAPFAGRIGIRLIDLGQYLSAGQEVVTLQSLNPIYVDFDLPEQDLPRIRVGQPVIVGTDAFPKSRISGEITAVAPEVTRSTRSFGVRAQLPNPEGRLLPGMFANVSVVLPERHSVVTLPQTAIDYSPYGNSVYLVHEEKTKSGETVKVVRRVFVETGAKRGDQVAIEKGVSVGDVVVTAGQLKLENGARVRIDNRVTPSDEAAPNPPER